ncbi:MAG: group II intron reverse transcriptase/maturase, partial [Moorea sp. SIO2I5]|nr:group II intron reverse transcriptase/maturase [Moorena sp. SIO2I5]
MSNTHSNVMVELNNWHSINWKSVDRAVFKLQKRIYKASQEGNKPKVRKLQKLLTKSKAARLLAVKRVTQDNRGKRTAGIDRKKELNPKERLELANNLKLDGKASPVRRIMIPKPGRKEKRPLGIPTINDRAKQALAKIALEPEWEAQFEPNSYGFRPGRSTKDAIAAIYGDINKT